MFDMFTRTHWFVIYDYFAGGHPPLILQLLALNTIFFVWFIIKRLRGLEPKKRHSSYHLQEILIFVNVMVLLQDQYMPFVSHRIMPMVDHVQRLL